MKTATALQTSLSTFSRLVVLFESVRSHELLINKTISKSLFLLLVKKHASACHLSSQLHGELHDFIVGANRDHCHRKVFFVVIRALLSHVLYCMSFSITSVP